MVRTDADEAMTLLDKAAQLNGFKPLSLEAGGVLIEIPRSLRKRRAMSRLVGAVSQTESGTEIVWACGDEKHRLNEHLLSLEETLPPGVMDYHGMIEASTASGLAFEGKKAFRNVVHTLGSDESVLAIAKGTLGIAAGMLALTDQRLLFVEDGTLCTPPLLDAPLESIDTLALGKKTTGETLRILLGPATLVISHMGHGEGHGIAAKFRGLMNERARTPRTASDGDQGTADNGVAAEPPST